MKTCTKGEYWKFMSCTKIYDHMHRLTPTLSHTHKAKKAKFLAALKSHATRMPVH